MITLKIILIMSKVKCPKKGQIFHNTLYILQCWLGWFTTLVYIHTTTNTDDCTNVACSITDEIAVQSYSLSGAKLLEYKTESLEQQQSKVPSAWYIYTIIYIVDPPKCINYRIMLHCGNEKGKIISPFHLHNTALSDNQCTLEDQQYSL